MDERGGGIRVTRYHAILCMQSYESGEGIYGYTIRMISTNIEMLLNERLCAT